MTKYITIVITIIFMFYSNKSYTQTPISLEDRIMGLTNVWSEAKQNYPYFDRVPGLNWDSLYCSYMAKVVSNDDPVLYYSYLQEFVTTLKDGHTFVKIPTEYFKKHTVGLYVLAQSINNELIICNVGTKFKNTIPIGSKLISIDGDEPFKHLTKNESNAYSMFAPLTAVNYTCQLLFYGDKGDTIIAKLKNPEGDTINITIPVVFQKDEWAGNYRLSKLNNFSYSVKDDIVYINIGKHFNKTMFDTLYKVLSNIEGKGMILDIRPSIGGSSMPQKIMDMFTDSTKYCFFKYSTRVNNAYKKSKGGYCNPATVRQIGGGLRYCNFSDYYNNNAFESKSIYAENTFPEKKFKTNIPIVVLSSWLTFSAAEGFYISLKSIRPDIITVGTPSGGSSVQPLITSLPNNGFLYIASLKCSYSNGEEFTQIKPDYLIEPTIEQIINFKDVQLEKANEIMESLINK